MWVDALSFGEESKILVYLDGLVLFLRRQKGVWLWFCAGGRWCYIFPCFPEQSCWYSSIFDRS